jgi:biotin transporter BioY
MLREEMTALVETALTRTRPGAAFTMAVLAALPLVSPPTASAAAVAGALANKGTASFAKGVLSTGGLGVILGPATGLLAGWLGTKAVGLTARSERERVCVTRHARRMVLYSFALCAILVLILTGAGELYPVTRFWLIVGILAWVGILLATILGINSRMQRDVRRIRKETGTEDAPA